MTAEEELELLELEEQELLLEKEKLSLSGVSGIDTSPITEIDGKPIPEKIKLEGVFTSGENITEDGMVPVEFDPLGPSGDDIREQLAKGRDPLSGLDQDILDDGDDIRARATLAKDQETADNYVRDALTDLFVGKGLIKEGEKVEFKKDEQGRLMFLDPKTNRLTHIDEFEFTQNDFKDMLGPAIPLTAGVLANIAVRLSLGPANITAPPGSVDVPAEAAGAAAGEILRIKIGELLGVNPELTTDDLVNNAAKEGALVFVGGKAGEYFIRSGSRLIRGPTTFNEKEAEVILSHLQENEQLIKKINARLEGQPAGPSAQFAGIEPKFNPTVGQQSGIPTVLDLEASVESANVTGSTGLQIALRERQAVNNEVLHTLMATLDPTDPIPSGRAGDELVTATSRIRGNVTDQNKEFQALAKEKAEAAKKELKAKQSLVEKEQRKTKSEVRSRVGANRLKGANYLDSLPETSPAAFNAAIRGTADDPGPLLRYWDNANAAETQAWSTVDEALGVNRVTGSSNVVLPMTDDFAQYIRARNKGLKQSLTTAEATGQKKITQGRIEEIASPEQVARFQAQKLGKILDEKITPDEEFVKEMRDLSDFLDGIPVDFDLNRLNNSIKYIRRLKRISGAKAESNGELAEVSQISAVEKQFVKLRSDALTKAGRGDLLETIEKAEAVTRDLSIKKDRSLLKDFVKVYEDSQGNKVFKLNDRDLFSRIFNNASSPEGKNIAIKASEELADVLQGDPIALQAYRNQVFALYKEAVQEGVGAGRQVPVLSPEKHNKFMDEYGEVIAPFFKDAEFKKIQAKEGNFAVIIKRQSDRARNTLNMIDRVTKGKLKDLGTEDFIEKSLGEELRLLNKLGKKADKTPVGKVSKLTPESAVKSTLTLAKKTENPSALSRKELKRVLQVLDRTDPGAAAAYRGGVLDTLKDVARKNDGSFDLDGLEKFLKSTGDLKGNGKISDVLGKQYMKDLRELVIAGARITQRRGKPLAKPNEAPEIRLFRVIWGPLSRPQRFITGAEREAVARRHRALFNSMTNPELLRQLIRQKNSTMALAHGSGLLSALGAGAIANEVSITQ